MHPALWGSQKEQCITNDEVGEGFAPCWGEFEAQGRSYTEKSSWGKTSAYRHSRVCLDRDLTMMGRNKVFVCLLKPPV